MYCISCGKEIPENSVFCKHCGVAQGVEPAPEAEPTPMVEPTPVVEPTPESQQQYHYEAPKNAINDIAKKDKKKKNIILIVCIVILALAFIGKMAASGGSDSANDDTSSFDSAVIDSADEAVELDSVEKQAEETGDNPEYLQIFRDRHIVEAPAFFMTEGTASFARVEDDGSVDCLQFGYEGDIISDFYEIKYVDISGMSESEKAEMDQRAQTLAAEYQNLDFVTAEGEMGSVYYKLIFKMEKLNDGDNLQKAIEKELVVVTSNSADYLSMAETESSLFGEGYIKK